MTNITFKSEWENIEKKYKRPIFARKLVVENCDSFTKKVFSENKKVIKKLVRSLYSGDIYLLKKSFSKKFCNKLITGAWKIKKTKKMSFHKMKGNCPNFHRLIDEKLTKKYSSNHIKHSFYFFPWNSDPLNMYEKIYKRWRAFKLLGGFKFNEFENNTTKNNDKVVDRFQIVHYPAGAGWLETHSDPYHNQRVIISGFLSERGKDYYKGGFYCYKKNGTVIDCDEKVETGDMLIGYATVLHGVSTIDPEVMLNYHSPRGRWFLGLYSNDTDVVKKRKTTNPKGKFYPSPSLPL